MASTTLTTTTGSTYAKSYGAAAYLTFNGRQIELTAADITIPRFSYVADSFYEAVNLGQFDAALAAIIAKFGSTTGLNVDDIKAKIESLANIPVLGELITSEILITEFVISPETAAGKNDGNYSFGIGAKLTKNNTIGPVTLDGISFTVKLQQSPS